MSIAPIPGTAAIGQLAQLYQQQLLSGAGSATGGTPAAASAGAADPATAARGTDFAGAIGNSLSSLANLDQSAQKLAVGAATGSLSDVQDYVIASTQAQVATELTTTVRNKALDSFNQIMGMPL